VPHLETGLALHQHHLPRADVPANLQMGTGVEQQMAAIGQADARRSPTALR
jgi:hypothetical protein